MPRIRTIKPEITTDRKLATVSLEARLTFIYTWTIADDDGLFRAEERQLLGSLFAHDSRVSRETLETWLEELVSIELLRWRTTKDGSRVGEIVNWRKHQKIDRPSASFISKELQPLTSRSRTRPRDTLATPSREARETLAPVVQSPESLPPSRAKRETWITPFWDAWREILGADPPKAILRFFEPLQGSGEWEDGTLLRRWTNFLTGIKRNPKYLGKPAAQIDRFVSTHAIYDDPEWHLSDRDRAEVAQLRESLGLP